MVVIIFVAVAMAATLSRAGIATKISLPSGLTHQTVGVSAGGSADRDRGGYCVRNGVNDRNGAGALVCDINLAAVRTDRHAGRDGADGDRGGHRVRRGDNRYGVGELVCDIDPAAVGTDRCPDGGDPDLDRGGHFVGRGVDDRNGVVEYVGDVGVLREGLSAREEAGNQSRDREEPGNAKLHGILPEKRIWACRQREGRSVNFEEIISAA
jgi:hypothetical protein